MEVTPPVFDWLVELGIVNPDEYSVPPTATFIRLSRETAAHFENGLNFGFVFEILAEDGVAGYDVVAPTAPLDPGSITASDLGLESTIVTPPVIAL